MTMENHLCDVCKVNPPIGVASTAMPLSVAYCANCAARHAQPECVFEYWEDTTPPRHHAAPDHFVTFVDGKYITYRKWYKARHSTEKGKV